MMWKDRKEEELTAEERAAAKKLLFVRLIFGFETSGELIRADSMSDIALKDEQKR